MAIIHIDGFDDYVSGSTAAAATDVQSEYAAIGIGGSFDNASGRFGAGALLFNSNGGYLLKTLPVATYTDLWQGGAYKNSGLNNNDCDIFTFQSPLGQEITISANPSTGFVKAWRGNHTTLLGTSAAVAGDTAWHWMEARAVLHATAGIVEVWVDGVRVLNLTAQNTKQNSTATGFDRAGFGSGIVSAFSSRGFDDWYVLDPLTSPHTSRLGDCKVVSLSPTSDAGPNDGTISTGTTHFGVVDEAQYNTTDYTDLANTSGKAEIFGLADLTASNVVYGVKLAAVALKTDAGTIMAAASITSGSTTQVGPTVSLLTGYARATVLAPVDPATSAAWTVAGVNALVGGLKII